MVVIVTREGARVLALEKPSVVRWHSPQEIIVEQSGPDTSQKILRTNPMGQILETITNGYFVAPEPAPDGHRIAVVHTIQDDIFKGLDVLEIRDLAEGFRLLRTFPREQVHTYGLAAWSPDGTQLAVSVESLEGTRIQRRLAVVSPETGTVRRLYDDSEDRERDPRGIMLMFWHQNGIYVCSARGVLRCDPEGAGCTAVYDPGEARHVIGGTLIGSDDALLLVKDVQADFLEHRAKEIHRINLFTGKGALWARLPDDLFVSDIDWIEAPDTAADQAGTHGEGDSSPTTPVL